MHHYGEDGVSNRILGVVIKGTAEAWDLRTTPIPSIHRRSRMKFKPGQLLRFRYGSGKEGGICIFKKIHVLGRPRHLTTCAVYSLRLDETIMVSQSLLSPASPQEVQSGA